MLTNKFPICTIQQLNAKSDDLEMNDKKELTILIPKYSIKIYWVQHDAFKIANHWLPATLLISFDTIIQFYVIHNYSTSNNPLYMYTLPGVIAKMQISCKTQFGPLQGLRTTRDALQNPENTAYVWEVSFYLFIYLFIYSTYIALILFKARSAEQVTVNDKRHLKRCI